MTGQINLREVEEADLPVFFENQRDRVAIQRAAFPPRERQAFLDHWRKILADPKAVMRAIVVDSEVAGYIGCFEQSGDQLVCYWLGRSFWGQGIASRALAQFLWQIPGRPLHAHVAKQNLASIRVLEKCGFAISGESRAAAATGGEIVDEFIFSLDR